MNFKQQFFQSHPFTSEQISQYADSAMRSLEIAEQEQKFPEVVFKFSYDALIKMGIAIIAASGYKVRSTAGHHIKILEAFAELLQDKDIEDIGNLMRKHRNLDLYAGGIEIPQKQSQEYLGFVKGALQKGSTWLREHPVT